MRAWTYLGVALVASLAIATPAASAPAQRSAISAQTRDNLVAAARGEAFAHAKYLAYADEAQRAGHADVARLFRRTGRTEFGDHFLHLAVMASIVNDNATNLRDAITGEDSEATTIYKGFADQAAAQGDERAAAMWRELAADEAVHRDNFQQALHALRHGGVIPAGPTVDPFEIVPGPPQSSGVTLENLFATLHGESFANAKYMAYGLKARATGQPRLKRLWFRTADVERLEHFAEAATLAGLVRGTATNLRDAIQGEISEATTIYVGYARDAWAAGDRAAARLFAELARDEAGHAAAFVAALQDLELPR